MTTKEDAEVEQIKTLAVVGVGLLATVGLYALVQTAIIGRCLAW